MAATAEAAPSPDMYHSGLLCRQQGQQHHTGSQRLHSGPRIHRPFSFSYPKTLEHCKADGCSTKASQSPARKPPEHPALGPAASASRYPWHPLATASMIDT
eukprot:GHUV01030490.1.p3 GENE.GHUV01030490.1~~GHUV01030490.1.p3  ORF type:complete len:101 (+),score=25.68 GHUV01030490.1:78-380(+)